MYSRYFARSRYTAIRSFILRRMFLLNVLGNVAYTNAFRSHTMPIKRLRLLDDLIRVSLSEVRKFYEQPDMKIKFFVITFAVFMVGAQCRSVTLSNVRDTDEKLPVNTPEQLKELIASYEENFGKLVNFAIKISKNKDNNEREIQFLNQLSSFMEQLIQKQSKALKNNSTMGNVNDVKDLINTIKEIDIVYQDGEITDEHIRIKRAAEGYKRAASFATEERMSNMLIDIQRQVVQIRKYLDKLCKKHNPTSTAILEINSDDGISSAGQPNKVAIM